MQRDPKTDPRAELSVPIFVDGSVWGVLNIEAPEPGAFERGRRVLVEAIAASLGSSLHRAMLVADLERTFTTTLTALMSTVEAKDDYTASHEGDGRRSRERVAPRLGVATSRQRRPLRGAAARRRQGRHPERDPAQAGAADRRGVGHDAQPRRRSAARSSRASRRSPTSRPPFARATSAGTAAAIPTASPARGSRSPRASSPPATPTRRSSPTAPTAPRASRRTPRASCCACAGSQLDPRVVDALLDELGVQRSAL